MRERFFIRLADLNIGLFASAGIKKLCTDYIISEASVSISVEVTDSALEQEAARSEAPSRLQCESLLVYRELAERLPQFSRFVFHGAAIEYDNKAYLFTAPSGTGKTTHIKLWQEYLGDKVRVINGDKPIVCTQNEPRAYGSAWAGKERMHNNISAPIGAVCIIKRGKENKIRLLSKSESISGIVSQVYLPQNSEALSKTLSLINELILKTPIYELRCDISKDAFLTSFNEITGGI